MKKIMLFSCIVVTVILYACGGGAGGNNNTDSTSNGISESKPNYDPHRGEGKFDHVDISPSLNTTMADA